MALLSAIGQIANLGQFVEIGQGHAHQQEAVRWARRNYELDTQALKIDLLGAARDDIRGTYDTYVERLDSLLLLNALILPFALNTLQFSDVWVPSLNCPAAAEAAHQDPNTECIAVKFRWMHTLWVYLVAIALFLPFWAILLVLQCKRRLDTWLQRTLEDLQMMRKSIITSASSEFGSNARNARSSQKSSKQVESDLAEEQQRVIADLGSFIVQYQDTFAVLWRQQCIPLVTHSTQLLWTATSFAVLLTSYMVWMYLANRPEYLRGDNVHFAGIIIVGFTVPGVYFLRYICNKRLELPPHGERAQDQLQTGVRMIQPSIGQSISLQARPSQSSPNPGTPNGALPEIAESDEPARRRSSWF